MNNSNETRQAEGVNGVTAEKIISKFINKDPAQMEDALWEWLITAMSSPDMDSYDHHDRSNLATLFRDLIVFVNELKQINS